MEELEPDVRGDQELKSDKQYYTRTIAFTALYFVMANLLLLLFVLVFSEKETKDAIANASEIFVWGNAALIALVGGFMGVNYNMEMKK